MSSPAHAFPGKYFKQTKSLLYSYLISLPLLLLYEVLILVAQPNTSYVVRISVDVWIRTLFSYFGTNILSITLIIVALTGLLILYYERRNLPDIKVPYFILMLFESAVYAFFLALIISAAVSGILHMIQDAPMKSLTTLQQLALSLGAGLYEELFFRVILVSALLFLFRFLFQKESAAFISAMIVAALIFSLVHYTGTLGDAFSVDSFLFRFLFGLALNAIYLWRGFGIAAWTHAIYDLMVIAVL